MPEQELVTSENVQTYPYGLATNPFPGAAVPSQVSDHDIGILTRGQTKIKQQLLSTLANLNDHLCDDNATAGTCSPLTIVSGESNSGKTHLALHLRNSKDTAFLSAVCYVDLADAMLGADEEPVNCVFAGFGQEYYKTLRRAVVQTLLQKAQKNIGYTRKIFSYDFVDVMLGTTLERKSAMLLDQELTPDPTAIDASLGKSFSVDERRILKCVIEGKPLRFEKADNEISLGTDDILSAQVNALVNINYKFIQKIILVQLDNFDSGKSEHIAFLNALRDLHASRLAIVLIPASSSTNDSLGIAETISFQLEPSRTLEDLTEMVIRHIHPPDNTVDFASAHMSDLSEKIKILYNEFPDLQEVSPMLQMMHDLMEDAFKRQSSTIDEASMENCINARYPSFRLTKNTMRIPISDYLRIKREISQDKERLAGTFRSAILNLIRYIHDQGLITKPIIAQNNVGREHFIDASFREKEGNKVALAVVCGPPEEETAIRDSLKERLQSKGFVDKIKIITNMTTKIVDPKPEYVEVASVDRYTLCDLIYFSRKYLSSEVGQDDAERAMLLAKSLSIC